MRRTGRRRAAGIGGRRLGRGVAVVSPRRRCARSRYGGVGSGTRFRAGKTGDRGTDVETAAVAARALRNGGARDGVGAFGDRGTL